jgi:hypothetical protein
LTHYRATIQSPCASREKGRGTVISTSTPSTGPGRLARAWARWKAIAHAIGNFQARVLLTVFYFSVVPPFALVLRMWKDPLALRPPAGASFWTARDESAPDRAASRQF